MRALQAIRDWVGAGGRLLKGGAGGRETVSPARWHPLEPIVDTDDGDDADELLPGRLQQEARAAALGIVLPNIRTKRDLAEAIAACEAALTEPTIAAAAADVVSIGPIKLGRRKTLSVEQAAALFVEHLREIGAHGPLGNDDIKRLYEAHCADLDVEEYAQNMLREALIGVPGVSKEQEDRRGSRGGRPTMWRISAAERLRAAA